MLEVARGLRLMIAISWRADRFRSLAALATAVGQMLSGPLRAVGLKVLVDGVVVRDVRPAVIGVVVVVGLGVVNRLMAWASLNIRMRLRENTQLYLDTHLMSLTAGIPGLEHHERPDYLDKVELLRAERDLLANPFNPVAWTVATVAQTVGVVALIASVHPLLGLLPIFGIPSVLIIFRAERAGADLKEVQAEPNRVRRHLMELATEVDAAKEIRIFCLGEELMRRRRRTFDELERDRWRLARRSTLATSVGWSIFAAGFMGAVAYAAHLATAGRASVGAVVLVLSLGSQLNQQLAELASNLAWLVQTHRAVGRLRWLTEYARKAHEGLLPARPARAPGRLQRGIAFHGVSFAYPGTSEPVLTGVDLILPAGATVAIVGDNGAGKTTLVKLLCRFYEPTRGKITVDGVDLRDIPVDDWRRRISAGFQDFGKLKLLAREAIGLGDQALVGSDADLLAALDRAGASDLPAAFPRGLETQLGSDYQDGIELSLGQWQKVALGRAMMRREPLLLLLDEPTASLDAASEHALFERFAGAARRAAALSGAITVLVSHRFSTVRMADVILVVAGGCITEAGDHATLVRAGGLYARLYELQARAYR